MQRFLSHILTPRLVLIPSRFNNNNPNTTNSTFASLGFIKHNPIPMPSAAAGMATAVGCTSPKTFNINSSSNTCLNSTRFVSSSNYTCRGCRCVMDSGGMVPSRAWAVLKENRIGGKVAWLHTSAFPHNEVSLSVSATGSEDNSGGDNVNVNDNDKSVKLNRRHRGFGGGGGGGALQFGNPDLLTIPGVGPRNLRKLVENGIGGVAELKQIYKDKFFGESS